MRLAIDEEAQGLACVAGGIVYVKVKFSSRAVKTGGKSRKLYLHVGYSSHSPRTGEKLTCRFFFEESIVMGSLVPGFAHGRQIYHYFCTITIFNVFFSSRPLPYSKVSVTSSP